jgi:hypothetical protein
VMRSAFPGPWAMVVQKRALRRESLPLPGAGDSRGQEDINSRECGVTCNNLVCLELKRHLKFWHGRQDNPRWIKNVRFWGILHVMMRKELRCEMLRNGFVVGVGGLDVIQAVNQWPMEYNETYSILN